mgnify:CR=1 FL=1
MKQKKERNRNNKAYIFLKDKEIELATLDTAKIGRSYIIEDYNIDFKKEYTIFKIRRRLRRGDIIEGINIYNDEPEENFKTYVSFIKRKINEKSLYLIN